MLCHVSLETYVGALENRTADRTSNMPLGLDNKRI